MRTYLLPWLLLPALLLGCPSDVDDDDSADDDAADDDAGDDDTAEMPDYSESPCWGTSEPTQLFDHDSMSFIPIDTTCRAEGERTMVYVADDIWEDVVDQDLVNRFMWRYELYSPEESFDPDQGVLFNDEEVFGAMDTSGFPNQKLAIFLVNTGGMGDGYICPTEMGWCDYYCIHLDPVQMDPIDGDYALAVAAHETFHMIHHFHDPNEHMWVDESLAEAAMSVNGFFTDVAWLDSFMNNPNQDWGPGDPEHGTAHYGGFLLWGTYLWEYGGVELMAAITDEPVDGWNGIDNALASIGDGASAWDLYLDMMVAMYVDDPALGYGFEFLPVGNVNVIDELAAGDGDTGALQPYGLVYYDLAGTGEVEIQAQGTGGEPVVALAVGVSADEVVVHDVSSGGSLDLGAADWSFLVLTAEGDAPYSVDVI